MTTRINWLRNRTNFSKEKKYFTTRCSNIKERPTNGARKMTLNQNNSTKDRWKLLNWRKRWSFGPRVITKITLRREPWAKIRCLQRIQPRVFNLNRTVEWRGACRLIQECHQSTSILVVHLVRNSWMILSKMWGKTTHRRKFSFKAD